MGKDTWPFLPISQPTSTLQLLVMVRILRLTIQLRIMHRCMLLSMDGQVTPSETSRLLQLKQMMALLDLLMVGRIFIQEITTPVFLLEKEDSGKLQK